MFVLFRFSEVYCSSTLRPFGSPLSEFLVNKNTWFSQGFIVYSWCILRSTIFTWQNFLLPSWSSWTYFHAKTAKTLDAMCASQQGKWVFATSNGCEARASKGQRKQENLKEWVGLCRESLNKKVYKWEFPIYAGFPQQTWGVKWGGFPQHFFGKQPCKPPGGHCHCFWSQRTGCR